MATKCFKPFSGRRMRVTRVDNLGRPMYGPCSTVVTSGFVTVKLSAEVEDGDETTVKAADGSICVSEKLPDQLKWLTVEMDFCQVDPDLASMINPSFTKLTDYKGDTVGWEESGTYSSDEGIALEVWMDLSGYVNDDRYAQGGWLYYLVPFITGGTVGDDEINNGALSLTLTGRTRKGNNWGRGPYNDVQLNPSPIPGGAPVAGPLLVPVAPDAPRRRFVTEIRPPAAVCGCQPLSNPDGPLVSLAEVTADTTRMTAQVRVGTEGSFRVDWGDGSAAEDVPAAGVSHRFTQRGVYNVSVWPTADPTKLVIQQVVAPFAGAVMPAVFVREDPADALNRRSVLVTVDNHGNGPVVIDWGDATATAENAGDGVAESQHSYPADGFYALTATDKSEATRTAAVRLKVPFGQAKPVLTVAEDVTDTTRHSVVVTVDNHNHGPVTIDWGDGTSPATNAGDNTDQSAHRYTGGGTDPVQVTVKATDVADPTASSATTVTIPYLPAMSVAVEGKVATATVINGGAAVSIDWDDANPAVDNPGDGVTTTTKDYGAAATGLKHVKATDKADPTKTHTVTLDLGPALAVVDTARAAVPYPAGQDVPDLPVEQPPTEAADPAAGEDGSGGSRGGSGRRGR